MTGYFEWKTALLTYVKPGIQPDQIRPFNSS
jgi:hypothetical protein